MIIQGLCYIIGIVFDYARLFTNAVPFLFEQVSFIIILCLLAIELISYLFLSRSFPAIRTQIKNLLTFKYPWDLLTVITWLLLVLMSILYLRNTSPVSTTYLSAGILLFFLGWLIRYQPFILRKLSKYSRLIRPLLRNYSDFWNKLEDIVSDFIR